MRDYWTRQWAVIEPHVEPVRFSPGEGGETVVEVHQLVKDHDGKTLSDGRVRHLYRFESGLILRMRIVKP